MFLRRVSSPKTLSKLTTFKQSTPIVRHIRLSAVQGAQKRIANHPTSNCPYLGQIPAKASNEAIQQDDAAQQFYMEIVDGSLATAYQKYGTSICHETCTTQADSNGKNVIIVGAGVAGLSAAFELEKVGYKTQIVELQHRVGGRTKTLRSGFADGLHAEGGAMRIPPNHYLTNGYINRFGIPVRPFVNYNGNTWLYLEGHEKIKTKDWESNNKYYSTKLFPGWDENIMNINCDVRPDVQGILDLYERTMKPVKDELIDLIAELGAQKGWEEWVKKWSKLSVYDFLRSNIGDPKAIYRPWPEIAIKGFELGTYNPTLNQSLVEYLRDELGQWWQKRLHTPVDGMETIAKHFIQPQLGVLNQTIHLANNITFGTKVRSVRRNQEGKVEVTANNTFSGNEMKFIGDAVILTVPLTILRQIDLDISDTYRRAISDIHYEPSTKVVMQCKSRFWEKELGQGGFTRTNMPIGQLHYPSPNDPRPPNDRGILVSYTWDQDALIFGSQSPENAINSAVNQIAKFHPEMKEEFEVGMVQAWFSDETAQGAFVSLLPFQYIDGMKTLMTPDHPVYLAGEAISYTNGWIQGAMESGLNAAYHLYSHSQRK